MNSWVFLSILVFLSISIGFIITNDSVDNQYRDYLYTKQEGYDELRDTVKDNMEEVTHASGEFNMDDTTGSTLGLTGNMWTYLDYGLNPWSAPQPTNVFEAFMVSAFGLYKSLIVAYTLLLGFMWFKNKKNT